MRKVLIAAPIHKVLRDGLESAGYTLIEELGITQKEAPQLLRDCAGVITSTRLQLDRELLQQAANLEWIGRMGSGMEVIDLEFAVEKGIRCYSSPEGNSNAVAEHAMGMLLSLTNRIGWSHREILEGKWLREENRGIELEGRTVGIIGFGHTGRAFAKKLRGFDVRVLAHDIVQMKDIPVEVQFCDRPDRIYEEADIVSFHVPLKPDTFHYLNREFIERMKKKFILVNSSRGAVVDTFALAKGIEQGKIRGACLDVFESEPLDRMIPDIRKIFEKIIRLPEVVVSPHIAGYSEESLYKMSKVLLGRIVTGS